MAMFINPMTPTDNGGDNLAARVWDALRNTPDIPDTDPEMEPVK